MNSLHEVCDRTAGSRKPGLEKEALGENAVVQNPRLVGVYLLMKIGCRYHSPSCEAAVVVKPKARLCEGNNILGQSIWVSCSLLPLGEGLGLRAWRRNPIEPLARDEFA